MASGWARDGAIQEQIDASVNDAVQYARSNLISLELVLSFVMSVTRKYHKQEG